VAFTLRAVRRSKAAPVCAPSAPHGAARSRTVPYGVRRRFCCSNRSRFDFAVWCHLRGAACECPLSVIDLYSPLYSKSAAECASERIVKIDQKSTSIRCMHYDKNLLTHVLDHPVDCNWLNELISGHQLLVMAWSFDVKYRACDRRRSL